MKTYLISFSCLLACACGGPSHPPELVFADAPFRQSQPAPGEARPAASPKPQLWQLPGGVEVVLVERHELPTVTVELVLVGGSAQDPPGKEGRAAVCSQLLGDTTARLDKVQLAELLGDLGSSVGAGAGVEETSFSAAALSRNLAPTLDLFAELLQKPGFRTDELARQLARRKAALLAAKGNPAQLAQRLLGSITYGPNHPRGRVTTEKSLAALTIADCQAHYATLGIGGAQLYVVGDLTQAQVTQEIGSRLVAWQAKGAAVPATPAVQPIAGKVFLHEVPKAQQSVVLVTHPGPKRLAGDYDATNLMMAVLGSGFSSRINQNLREQKGWAYGAGGGYAYTREDSMLVLQASVRADATGGAVEEILREMQQMRAAEATADELAREKQGAILSLPARWATGRSIGSTFQSLRYFGLPLGYFDSYVARVQAVDAKAVLAAAEAYVRPSEAKVLILGDPAVVQEQLAKLLAAGPLQGATVIRLDADGQVIAP